MFFNKIKTTNFLLLAILIFGVSIYCFGQNDLGKNRKIKHKTHERNILNKIQVDNMVKGFNKTMFEQMNPLAAYRKYVYLGKLTAEESEYFPREFLQKKQEIPFNLRLRYLSIVFARNFPKVYYILGMKDFSNDFENLHYAFSALLSSLEKDEYNKFFSIVLEQNNLSKTEFESFFESDVAAIDERYISKMEKIFGEFLAMINKRIDKKIYEGNLKQLNTKWEISREKLDKNSVYNVVLEEILLFVVSRKNRSPKIIEFPRFIN